MKKLSERMDAAMEAMDGERVRWLLGKKISLTEGENVFGKQIAENRYDLILINAASAEFTRNLILKETMTEPRSVPEVAEALDMEPEEVLRHFIAMRRWRLVEDAGERDGYLLFQAAAQVREKNEGA